MVESRSAMNIWILDYAPIEYTRRCSSLLLNHLPLEESASITLFLFPFLEFCKLLNILAVDRCGKMDMQNLLAGNSTKHYGQEKRYAEIYVVKLKDMNVMDNL